MEKRDLIKLFEGKNIRYIWDDEKEDWYFSVLDLISFLTDCSNPEEYIKEMLSCDEGLRLSWNTICIPVQMPGDDGKSHEVLSVNTQGLFRIIQSVPSIKAEPFKNFLAEMGAERLNQMQNPELSIKQALQDYRRKGYSDNWINMRLKSIEIKKDLTDQWNTHNVKEHSQHVALTDVICKTWSGKTVKEYKKFKGLKKESLQDNMSNIELVLNMLAEVSASSITEVKNPQTYKENMQCAFDGGSVAAVARQSLEKELGLSVVSSLNAKALISEQPDIKKLDGD
ncbi:BRO-N domain-containing protein [Treponema porcinum]|uniref:BRO-N domain-containing protein n=1 Tax=Treponema porcinum TaxID=261392 RepID=UPI0023554474|nr:Bro-N domain-containing protein [Treponema porcinum]MCI6480814.1 Bro-N domain-containing protein [Treponema porcinum]